MCTADAVQVSGDAFNSVSAALRVAGAAVDYLNSPAVASLDGAACGELLIGLGEVQAKLAAAHAEFLRSHAEQGGVSSNATPTTPTTPSRTAV